MNPELKNKIEQVLQKGHITTAEKKELYSVGEKYNISTEKINFYIENIDNKKNTEKIEKQFFSVESALLHVKTFKLNIIDVLVAFYIPIVITWTIIFFIHAAYFGSEYSLTVRISGIVVAAGGAFTIWYLIEQKFNSLSMNNRYRDSLYYVNKLKKKILEDFGVHKRVVVLCNDIDFETEKIKSTRKKLEKSAQKGYLIITGIFILSFLMPNPKGLDETGILKEFENRIGKEQFHHIPFEFADIKFTGIHTDLFKTDNNWSANFSSQTEFKDNAHIPYSTIMVSTDRFAFAKDFNDQNLKIRLFLTDKNGAMLDNLKPLEAESNYYSGKESEKPFFARFRNDQLYDNYMIYNPEHIKETIDALKNKEVNCIINVGNKNF